MTIRIGLYGYFYRGAYGDEVIRLTTAGLIKDAIARRTSEEVVIIDNLWLKRPLDFVSLELDLIVLCGGSLFYSGPLYDLVRTKIPVCIFGTGFRGVDATDLPKPKDLLDGLHELIDIAKVVSVRGPFTRDWLLNCGADVSKIQPAEYGDPALAFRCKRKPASQFIVGGNIRTDTDQQYLVQHAERFMQRVYQHIEQQYPAILKLIPFRYTSGDNDSMAIERAGYSPPESPLSLAETLELLTQCEYWVGQRLHPFIVALCCGIKAVGIGYQFSKLRDVVSVLNYPYWMLTTEPLDKFDALFRQLIDDDDVVLNTLERIREVNKGLNHVADRIVEVVV